MQILHIDSSIFDTQGASSQLAQHLISQLQQRHPDAQVVRRSVSADKLPHFDAETIGQIGEGKAELADTLIAEVQNADVVILGIPMYNFGIPSQLKSWFDHIARAGVTFRYTANGPEGLLTGKQVYALHSRGGLHQNTERDTIVPFLNTMLGFVGLDQVEHVFAEGLSMSEHKDSSLDQARQHIDQLFNEENTSEETVV